MDKLALSPDEDGYSFKDGLETLRAQLEGGAGRFSRGILNASILLNVQWTCDEDEYELLRAAYREHVSEGHAPFPIDLFIDSYQFTEHQVKILPGSFGLSSHTGLVYIVSAQLEVLPTRKDTSDTALLELLIPPDKNGYSFQDTPEVLHTPVAGGLGRTRRDQIGTTTVVNVKWTVGPAGFLYLRNFYRAWVGNPREGFPIDLFLDNVALEPFTAQFIPGSMGLDSVNGHTFVLSAQLEIISGSWPIGAGVTPDAGANHWLFFDEGNNWAPLADPFSGDLTVPIPFVDGVGAVNEDGFGANEQYTTDVLIPLYTTNALPEEPEEVVHTWAPASGSSTRPWLNPWQYASEADWSASNCYLTITGSTNGWEGGVFTLYANNDTSGNSGATVITYLPGSFVYPPASIEYVGPA